MQEQKKLSKNQIRLIRFCVCLAAFIVLYAVGKTVGMPWYVGLATYLVVYLAIGYDVLYRAARNIVHGQVFDENFLMCVATVGAFAIGEYPEAAAVMLFYQLGELFQDYAVGKSRKSIASLMDIRPDKAVIFKDGQETEVVEELYILFCGDDPTADWAEKTCKSYVSDNKSESDKWISYRFDRVVMCGYYELLSIARNY